MKILRLDSYLRKNASWEMKFTLSQNFGVKSFQFANRVFIVYASPFWNLFSRWFNGAGYWRFIVVMDKRYDFRKPADTFGEGLLIEEFIHLWQQRQGLFWWTLIYFWQWIARGYEHIYFEIEARQTVLDYYKAVYAKREAIK